jgi:hypothetical protein
LPGFRVVPITTIRDPSGQLPPALTGGSSGPNTVQIQAAGRDAIIPILYGGPERMGGLLYWVGVNSNLLYVVNVYCEGPVAQIDVADLEINDVPVYDPTYATAGLTSGTLARTYDGSQTTVDPWLASTFGWTETLEGFAYSVVIVSPGGGTPEGGRQWVTGFPRVTAKIKGKKVYDPRADPSYAGSGGCLLSDPSTWIWTDNPALILGDFLYSYCSRTVEQVSLVSAAAACDTLVIFGSPLMLEKSSQMTLVLTEKKPVEEWIDILRGYMPGWVQDHGDFVKIIVDEISVSVDHAFTSSNIAQEPAPRLTTRGIREVPNVVEVAYTQATTLPYSPGAGSRNFTNYVSVGTGDTKARIELPGIRSYSMARRFATTRYNHYHLEPIEGQISVFDYGVRVLPGDRATITEAAWGWTAQDVRVLEVRDNGNGRWTVHFRVYDQDAYDLELHSTANTGFSVLPDPGDVPALSGIVLSENQTYHSGTWHAAIRVTWNPPDWPYVSQYRVLVETMEGSPAAVGSPAVVHSDLYTTRTDFVTPDVTLGVQYRVTVYVVSTLGLQGSGVSDTKAILPNVNYGGTTQAPVYMSTSPPPVAVSGSLWWDTDYGKLYVYYVEPGSPSSSQWVSIT